LLDNLVNADDLAVVARKVANGNAREVAARLRRSGRGRVESHWEEQWDTALPPTQWFDLEAVRRRENRLVSGDPDVGYIEHLARTHLAGRTGLRALSLGCGSGWRELEWARRAGIASLLAFDISEAGVKQARADAAAAGLDGVVDFRVGDVGELQFAPGGFDLILLEDALHHFTPLDEIVPCVRSWLAPDGHLIVNEFVGPTRFQFTPRQLELADAMLRMLPERHRREWDGTVKRRVARPSRLRMRIKDPSEAVESGRIMPLLHECFDVVEEKATGGTITYLVLDGIAHNFLGGDALAGRLLELCFEWEERLIADGEIGSDHMLAVCRAGVPQASGGAVNGRSVGSHVSPPAQRLSR
jgi:2-polyprenyl-3-methyl-5-hydroxy-6-metoxy-1,4-benzoquinol methylase